MSKRKSRKIVINAPKYYYPGKGRPREEMAYISPREKRGLLDSTDHTAEMTEHGILSFADDSASSSGVSRGDASQGTVGSSGKQQSSANAATGSSNYGGGSTKQSGSSNSTGASNYGGGSTKQSGSSNSTGSSNYGGGPSTSNNAGQSKSNNAATGAGNYGGGPSSSNNAGQSKSNNAATGAGNYGDGSKNAGQNPAQGTPASPGMSTPSGNQSKPAGGLLGSNPLSGTPASPGMSTPSALLNATRVPKSINDRIQPDRTDPLADANNRVPGSILDPTNPIGRPATLEQLKKGYNVDPGFNSPEARWQQNLNKLRAPEGGTTAVDEFGQDVLSRVNYKGRAEAATQDIANPFADPNITPTIDDVKAWGRQVIDAAKQMGLPKGHTSIGPYQTTTTNIGRIADELGLPGSTPMTSDTYNAIATKQIQNNPTLSDWDESLGQGSRKQRDLAAGFADSSPPDYGQGLSPNYNDPVATAGLDFGGPPRNEQQNISDALGGRINTPHAFSGGTPERPFSSNLPGDTRIEPAGGPTKAITSQVPQQRVAIPDISSGWDSAPSRHYMDQVDALSPLNPNALQPETENTPVPAPTRSLVNAPKLTDRIPPSFDPRMNPEPSDLDPTSPFKNAPARVQTAPDTPEIISPEQPTEVTAHTTKRSIYGPEDWNAPVPGPTNLNPAVNRPSPAFNQTGRGSDQQGRRLTNAYANANIPVHAEVQDAIVQRYGEAEGTDILATVAAVKQAMAPPRRGATRSGIGRLAQAPRRKSRQSTTVPEDAPRLGA